MKHTSGRPHRFESTDIKWEIEHPQCAKMLRDAGWFVFFGKITGFNMKVSTEFARIFTGTRVEFDSIIFEIFEQSIVEATRSSTEG